MKFSKLLFPLLLSSVLFSCQEKVDDGTLPDDIPDTGETTTTVSINLSTVTDTSPIRKEEWEKGETVIVNGIQSQPLERIESAKAYFEFTAALERPYCIISPADAYSDEEVSVTTDRLVSYAYAGRGQAANLKPLQGSLRLPLRGGFADSDVRYTLNRVILQGSGEQLWGDFTLDFTTGTLTSADTSSEKSSLTKDLTLNLSPTSTVYLDILLPVGYYEDGFSMRLHDTDGNVVEHSISQPIRIEAGQYTELSLYKYRPGAEDTSISGVVKATDGTLLEGVVVSDGRTCVRTNQEGKYSIPYYEDTYVPDFIMVTVPNGYAAPVVRGLSSFYKTLSECLTLQSVDFVLEPIVNPESYTLFMPADPQIRSRTYATDKIGFHSIDCMYDLFKDMAVYSSSFDNCYAICLGDLVHEDMTLWPEYVNQCATLDFPMFNVIGNHDHLQTATTEAEGHADYEKYLGPRNYSINIGKFHYIILDNIIMNVANAGRYSYGLTDDIWTWLKNDLAFVPYDTQLIVCSHATMLSQSNGADNWSGSVHGKDYADLFSKYKKVYSFAGHAHIGYNYVYETSSPYSGMETHIIARSGGQLWVNDYISHDGTPRGYLVCKIDGENITWKYRPIPYQCGTNSVKVSPSYSYRRWEFNGGVAYLSGGKVIDESVQIQGYDTKAYGDGYIYANVFMWDNLWGNVILTTSAGKTYTMSKVDIKDSKAYDAAESELVDHYLKYNTRYEQLGATKTTGNTHLFRVRPSETTGSGVISVTDRFGQTFTADITW